MWIGAARPDKKQCASPVTTQSFRFPRFFATAPGPCPYLPDRVERKVFTELAGPEPGALNESLTHHGFRRSQMVAYRPSCDGCNACVSVRIPVDRFVPSANMRRVLKRGAAITRTVCQPWATDEQYDLLRRYLAARHPDGGMSNMDVGDYVEMIERSPVPTTIYEYRLAERLIGVCLTDHFCDGVSMVYSFFDPDCAAYSLGTYIILDHIAVCAESGLPYVYLGYWIAGSRAMDYKQRFQPLEMLGQDGWTGFATNA